MRRVHAFLMAIGILAALGGGSPTAGELPAVKVYKTATCGCCGKWAEHLEKHGFPVETTDVDDLARVKASAGVPGRLVSCHTGLVAGYFVEGHVPAEDVQRLVETKPDVRGIGVPGMPIGSPGMEGPNPERYQVYAVDDDGNFTTFAEHGP